MAKKYYIWEIQNEARTHGLEIPSANVVAATVGSRPRWVAIATLSMNKYTATDARAITKKMATLYRSLLPALDGLDPAVASIISPYIDDLNAHVAGSFARGNLLLGVTDEFVVPLAWSKTVNPVIDIGKNWMPLTELVNGVIRILAAYEQVEPEDTRAAEIVKEALTEKGPPSQSFGKLYTWEQINAAIKKAGYTNMLEWADGSRNILLINRDFATQQDAQFHYLAALNIGISTASSLATYKGEYVDSYSVTFPFAVRTKSRTTDGDPLYRIGVRHWGPFPEPVFRGSNDDFDDDPTYHHFGLVEYEGSRKAQPVRTFDIASASTDREYTFLLIPKDMLTRQKWRQIRDEVDHDFPNDAPVLSASEVNDRLRGYYDVTRRLSPDRPEIFQAFIDNLVPDADTESRDAEYRVVQVSKLTPQQIRAIKTILTGFDPDVEDMNDAAVQRFKKLEIDDD